jgi:AraC-like DNA-binding protein
MIPPLAIDPERLPQILLAGRFPLRDRGFAPIYRHAGCHALHLHGYAGRWRWNSTETALEPGTLTLSHEGVATAYDLDQSGWHWCLHFRCTSGVVAVPALVRLGADAAYARARLARIVALCDGARTDVRHPRRQAAAAALLELLIWLAELPQRRSAGNRRADAAITRAAAVLRAEPARSWRTPELARRVGLSANWLAARFRQRFGMTIDRYRQAQQVELARILLGSTALPVADIGARIGVPDAQRFNKLVRAHLGVAPSALRGGEAGR